MAQDLLAQLAAGEAKFADVIAYIETRYTHTPTAFKNGQQSNATTENQGSAKVFAFARLNRQFMQNGWDGIAFEGQALTAK